MHKRTSGSRAAGVSPPWLGKRACRAIRFVFDERTHLDKSGGRQPAVGLQTASATALRWISALQVCISRTFHGGLTPPALVLVYGRPPAKNDFFDAQTHVRLKSGGRQPAVVGETRLQGDSLRVRRTNARRPRAAGVSPPCCRKTYLQRRAIFAQRLTFARCKQPHDHGGLTSPALVLVYGRPPAKNDFFDAQTHVRLKSGGRQPAVVGETRLQGDSLRVRGTNARRPRAAGVSPPWLGTRVCSGETLDIYVAIQNRHPTRKARLQRRDSEQTEDWLARLSAVGFQNGGVPIYRPIATSGLDSKSVVQSLVC